MRPIFNKTFQNVKHRFAIDVEKRIIDIGGPSQITQIAANTAINYHVSMPLY